jgi:hypothetical protein
MEVLDFSFVKEEKVQVKVVKEDVEKGGEESFEEVKEGKEERDEKAFNDVKEDQSSLTFKP